MKTRTLAAALLLASLTPMFAPPRAAHAQPADDATVMARTRFSEGVAFYEKNEFEKARLSFLQAWQLKKHPEILINLAWSCLKSGHLVEAERYFTQLVRDSAVDGTRKADAQKGLDEAHAKLGKIEFGAAAGTEVTLDSERLGVAPLDSVYVEPGGHTVRFKGADGTTESRMVTVLAGEAKSTRFGSVTSSTPPRDPPPPRDNNPVPQDTSTPHDAPPSRDTTSDTSGGRPTPPNADEGSKKSILAPPKNLVPVAVLGVLSVAGFGTAIAMLVIKGNAQNNLNDVAAQIKAAHGSSQTCANPPTSFQKACSTFQSDIDAVNADATVGNIALAVGIAGVAGTVVYWLVSAKNDTPSTATAASRSRPIVAPMVGAHVGGLLVSGSF